MGVLEIHTWNSRFEQLELPDRIVLDLDPGEKTTWAEVIKGARLVKRLLDRTGLTCFVKTTGGRGLHVVVPLTPRADWRTCLEFSRQFAELIVSRAPQRYTTDYAKAGRERKILIDYLRNNRTNTSIAAYSTRARPGAPVSTPIRWSELKETLDPRTFTIASVERRLSRLKTDPWAAYWSTKQEL
jgi:bifunctional non-homologous end joining protein LigD